MSIEKDIIRSEDEGFGLGNYNETEKDKNNELNIFLEKTVEIFKNDSNILELSEAGALAISRMSKEEKEKFVDIFRLHFVPSICTHHDRPVVNDEHFPERTSGEETIGSITDDEVTLKNVANLLIQIGQGSLEAHLKASLTKKEWNEIESLEVYRQLDNFRSETYTAG